MASIFDMLTRQQPQFQTRQALLVLGLQHDFVSPEGHLPVTNGERFIRRIRNLVPAFRANGDVYWVRTENRITANKRSCRSSSSRDQDASSSSSCVVITAEPTLRPSDHLSDRVDSILGNDDSIVDDSKSLFGPHTDDRQSRLPSRPKKHLDPELYLSPISDDNCCCKPQSKGSQYVDAVRDLQTPQDTHLTKTQYSAFNGTSLLLTLRARLVTELYLVGCMSNLCVYATALDAARHGIQINIVEDCLGYRSAHRHAEAINRMIDDMGASITTSATVMSRFDDDAAAPDSRGASPEPDTAAEQSVHVQDIAPFTIPTYVDPPNSSTRATRPTSAEDQRSPTGLPLADFVVPDYVASSCALGEEPDRSAVADPSFNQESGDFSHPLYQNLEAIRSIERFDAHARTKEWCNSCSSSDEASEAKEKVLEGSVADTGIVSPSEVPREATPDSAEGRTSRKRRSADLEDISLGLAATNIDPSTAHPSTEQHRIDRPKQKKSKVIPSLANFPTKKPGNPIGAGDTTIAYNLISPSEAHKAFNALLSEVPWQRMSHVTGEVPRLVCCQGTFDPDGSMPVYRHPSDSSLPLLHWSPTVDRIRHLAQEHVGHELNHVLIQLYRSGQDHISEHSDKTLDIVPDSKIVNVSLGAQRTMRLRSKRMKFPPAFSALSPESECRLPSSNTASDTVDAGENMPPPLRQIFDRAVPHEGTMPARTTERIPMPHGSILSMGLETNARFLHSIQPDKRAEHDLSDPEKAYGGVRISLTFRQIGTFLDHEEERIWGLGARVQERNVAGAVVNGDQDQGGESEALLKGFGKENQGTKVLRRGDDEWSAVYGAGSDVLHLKTGAREKGMGMLFLSGEHVDDAVQGYVRFLGRRVEVLPSVEGLDGKKGLVYRDGDRMHTEVSGWVAVLGYLQAWYGGESDSDRGQVARQMQLMAGLETFRSLIKKEGKERAVQELDARLETLDADMDMRARQAVSEGRDMWMAGPHVSAVDFGYWALIKGAVAQRDHPGHLTALGDWTRRMERLMSADS
ncbi:Pyrazinamidase/nicotinamidase [Sphaceloma murrayae]|uniref:Pyrazinamidase/nicotinamidase n=1 Tax=Sphaceloma murrayae TaxID=2082308 RepID=A0A2K1QVL6_9PEZI|nr:Pyrazinamidase/nicotinamidase [Sphaceloma murrayae]